MSSAIAGILLFNVAFGSAVQAEEREPSPWEAYVHMGAQVAYSDATMGGFGARYKNKNGSEYELDVTLISSGDTKWGEHKESSSISITKIVQTNWLKNYCPVYIGVGYANVRNMPLVGNHNFNVVLGCNWGPVRAYLNHKSNWGLGSSSNAGLDGAHVSYVWWY